MDQTNAESAALEATPIFTAYRRGYDPVQVDRYVAEQQRRLDEGLARAGEAERKLAAAVGQLRELHRRVAVLESEDRSPQPAPLDALGERVQRILQEAWEGAYALRQQAETEVAAMRAEIAGEAAATLADAEQKAAALVADADRRAAAIDAEIERRRTAWNARLEEDRAKAVAQIAHLHAQRSEAVGELLRLRGMIEKAVQDLGGSAAAEQDSRPAAHERPRVAHDLPRVAHDLPRVAHDLPLAVPDAPGPDGDPGPPEPEQAPVAPGQAARAAAASQPDLEAGDEVDLGPELEAERVAAALLLARRAVPPTESAVRVQRPRRPAAAPLADETVGVPTITAPMVAPAAPAGVFDFEEEQPS